MVLAAQESKIYSIPSQLPDGIFRTYDIRGEVSATSLTVDVAYAIGRAIGTMVLDLHQQQELIVGRDGRLSGADMKAAFITGVLETGCNVIDIGMVPTPLLYFATKTLVQNSGVMITASHNPASHNGFKMVLDGKTVSSEGVQDILQRIKRQDFRNGAGSISEYTTIIVDYLEDVTSKIKLQRKLKVVIDCGNGAACLVAPELYNKLGCDVVEMYSDIDGNFPNHHPDPTVPENLVDIIAKVKETGADIGLAFDGDADRLGVVTNKGEIIWPDRQVMLFAKDLLSRNPGADIVFDVKCSNNLEKVIRESGGNPVMYRTGHSILKAKMLELNAPMAGEMSGHIFFCEDWYGFDDGLYVGARLLRILSEQNKTCSELFATLPDSINTPELKLPMAEEDKPEFMQRLLSEADFGDAKRITIDGLRIDFGYGWGLVRPSNTSAYLVLRFEADTEQHLDAIRDIFRRELLKINSELQLPY